MKLNVRAAVVRGLFVLPLLIAPIACGGGEQPAPAAEPATTTTEAAPAPDAGMTTGAMDTGAMTTGAMGTGAMSTGAATTTP